MKIKTQKDYKDCGVVCIQAFSYKYHGKWQDINTMKSKATYSEHGLSGTNLIALGKQFGVALEGYQASSDELIKSDLKNEFIALIDSNGLGHYVIAKKSGKNFIVDDPVFGTKLYARKKFDQVYRGIFYIPSEIQLIKHKKPQSIASYAFANSNLTVIVMIQMLIALLLTFASTSFMKVIMDKVIPGRLTSTLNVVVVTFVAISLLRISNNFVKGYLVEKINMRVSHDLTNVYYQKLTSTKMSELNKLSHSDHIRRMFMINEVSAYVANSLFFVFNQGTTLIISIGLLMWISIKMFAIAFGIGMFIMLITYIFQTKFKNVVSEINESGLELMNVNMEKINSFKEQKNPDYEQYLHLRYSKSLLRATEVSWGVYKTKTLQNVIFEALNMLVPMLLTYVGTKEVFANELSFGTLMMFLSIFNHFFSPLNDIALFLSSISTSNKNVELLSSILNFEDDELNDNSLPVDKIRSITLTPMTFAYDKPIFKTNGFKIDSNLHVIGKNGSGKSSLLQLISGNYFGTENILVNDSSLSLFDLKSYRSKIFISTPNTFLPDGKTVEVITYDVPDYKKTLFENIEKYNLIDLISELNINFNIYLTNNGQNLSSGQKQIVQLLRLFTKKFDLIILDEALENIDENKVAHLKDAINDYQKEAIFIEVSHSKRYVSIGKEVNIEKIAQNPY